MSKRDPESNSDPDPNRNTYFNTKANADTEASPKSGASPNAATLGAIDFRLAKYFSVNTDRDPTDTKANGAASQ